MKRLFILALCIMTLSACGGKDEPKLPTPPTSEGTNEQPKDDDKSKDDDPKDEEQKPSEPDARPSDYEMASRATVSWRVAPEVYYRELAFDELRIKGSDPRFTTEYLAQWVRFGSSKVADAKAYAYTEEDLRQTVISDVKYEPHRGGITFTLSYRGVTGRTRLSLPFAASEYYVMRVKLNPAFAAERYLYGVSQNVSLYLSRLVEYDMNRYTLELADGSKPQISSNSNTMSLYLRLSDQATDRELATFNIDVPGFRSLEHLSTDMKLYQTLELVEYLRRRVGALQEERVDVTALLSPSIRVWETLIGRAVRGESLSHVDNNWRPDSSGFKTLDLYFDRMRFELVSAVLEGSDVKMRLALVYTNETAVDNVVLDLNVRAVRTGR